MSVTLSFGIILRRILCILQHFINLDINSRKNIKKSVILHLPWTFTETFSSYIYK